MTEMVFFYSETYTNPQRAHEVFTQMRGMGADAVVIAVYEQDLIRWKPDMIRLFELAAEAGLRRYVTYGRHGGVFSGLLMVPSHFAFSHPETLIVTDTHDAATSHGELGSVTSVLFQKICCVNHPLFQEYMQQQTQQILEILRPDGLLFDEPKGLGRICRCEHCHALSKDGESDHDMNLRTQVAFVQSLCEQGKAYRSDLKTMLVVGHHHEDALARFASVESLDVLGVEAYWYNRGEKVGWLEEWCPATVSKLKAFGKQTQIWANNWNLPENETENLTLAYEHMKAAQPDQLCSFWWWRGSADPVRVMDLTAQGIARSLSE
jgi:hypothetical protein